ncbi:SPX domain-containing protein [Histoplasma capsulatum]|uniref:SPX domain-containing protein n=1 Tax=Ajellomyces capsulatus TaxID=5037 RepID=A0A8A1MN70_AJECA|nr:SPX domain-containing protein [Histoplasma capsulatum]
MELLNGRISGIEKLYAELVTKGDLALSKRELRLHLREHVVWERNTVWREMIGIERKSQAANMGVRRTLLAGDQDPLTAQRQGDEQEPTSKEILYFFYAGSHRSYFLRYAGASDYVEARATELPSHVGFCQFTLVHGGDPTFRHIIACPLPCGHSPHYADRRETLPAPKLKRSNRSCFRGDVDARNYALAWRLYYCCCFVEI